VWRKWKRRYMVLVQVSQYTFALCSYKDKKSEPAEMMQLDGFTVDYIELASGKSLLLIALENLKSIVTNIWIIFKGGPT
jgi:hypothetical protein